MSQCAGTKADSGRCGAQAITGSQWCFSHHPDYEEARRRRAAKGGKRGGRGRPGADLADLKRDVHKVIGDVLAGNVLQGPGAVALQGYNTLLRATKVELDIRRADGAYRAPGGVGGRPGVPERERPSWVCVDGYRYSRTS